MCGLLSFVCLSTTELAHVSNQMVDYLSFVGWTDKCLLQHDVQKLVASRTCCWYHGYGACSGMHNISAVHTEPLAC